MKLILISQDNCSGCTQMLTHLDDVDVEFSYTNASRSPEVIEKYNIMGAPTLILFDGEEEFTRIVGYDSEKVADLLLLKEENE